MYGKLAFLGTLSIGAIIAGPIMLCVADSRLEEYNKYSNGYYNDSSVMEFMEENVDEEQLYSLDNQENVVLSKNEWDRLKEQYENQVVVAQDAFEAGILTQEFDLRKDNFLHEFKNAIKEQDYVSIVAGDGIIKANEANLSLRNAGTIMTCVFTGAAVVVGAIGIDMVVAG